MPYTYFPAINQNVSWGSICGNIASQTDLADLIDSKADIDHSHDAQENVYLQYIAFSRYGAISTATYFHQEIVKLPEGATGELLSAQMYINSGNVELSVLHNSIAISELSELEIGQTNIDISISSPVSIADNDTIGISIDAANDLPADLYCKICILIKW